jgi:hypothetical protein
MKNFLELLMQTKIINMVLVLMLVLVHQMLHEKVIIMIQLELCLNMLMLIMMEELINKNLDHLWNLFKSNLFLLPIRHGDTKRFLLVKFLFLSLWVRLFYFFNKYLKSICIFNSFISNASNLLHSHFIENKQPIRTILYY